MDYVNLGRTGLKVSRLCLGCPRAYGSSAWRNWVLDDAASRPFFAEALELGINFFDTADMYSDGANEEVLGRAMRDLKLRSKWWSPPRWPDRWAPDRTTVACRANIFSIPSTRA